MLEGATFKDGMKVKDDEATKTDERAPPDDSSLSHPQHLTIARPWIASSRCDRAPSRQARKLKVFGLCIKMVTEDADKRTPKRLVTGVEVDPVSVRL